MGYGDVADEHTSPCSTKTVVQEVSKTKSQHLDRQWSDVQRSRFPTTSGIEQKSTQLSTLPPASPKKEPRCSSKASSSSSKVVHQLPQPPPIVVAHLRA